MRARPNENLRMSISKWAKRVTWFSITALSLLCLVSPAAAADPVLDVAIGGETRHFARDALLARPDVVSVEIADDVAYGKAMRFRAVPLAAFLARLRPPAASGIEAGRVGGVAGPMSAVALP